MPPFEFFEPDRRARQPVGRHDVVHQEAVDVRDGRFLIEIAGQQIGMPRLGAAVAADVQVVTLLGGDQANVFALGFGTFADAARHGHLDFVRCADALVAIFDANRKTDGILHAVAAPRGADAALDRPQRLCRRRGRFQSRR